MVKHKHLTLQERYEIQHALNNNGKSRKHFLFHQKTSCKFKFIIHINFIKSGVPERSVGDHITAQSKRGALCLLTSLNKKAMELLDIIQ